MGHQDMIDKDTGKIETEINITALHNSSFHLMKDGKEKSKNFTTNDVVRRHEKFVISALINLIDIYTAAYLS